MRGMGRLFTMVFCLAVLLPAQLEWAGAEEAPLTLTLGETIAKALDREALVRQAEQEVTQARLDLLLAKSPGASLNLGSSTSSFSSSGLDPQSSVSGTDYSDQTYSSSVNVPLAGGSNLSLDTSAYTATTNSSLRSGGGTSFTYGGASAGVGLSSPLPVFRDERVLSNGNLQHAEITLQAAELRLQEAKRNIVSTTLADYYEAVRAQRRAGIAQASLQNAEEFYRIARENFQLGKIAEIDAQEAKVSADSARLALRKANSNAATALETLKNYLGLPLAQPLQLSYTPETAKPLQFEEAPLVETASQKRLDLRQLMLAVRSLELTLRQTEAQQRPGVSLVGGYSRSGEATSISESFHRLTNPSWNIGISTVFSLSPKADRAAVAEARAALQVAKTDEALHREEIRLEIRRLLREAQDANDNVALMTDTVKTAEENLSIRQVQFEHGLIRPIDIMQTEKQLSETQAQALDAAIDFQLAQAQLSLAAGEMPEFNQVAVK
jgi:outer membrane protein